MAWLKWRGSEKRGRWYGIWTERVNGMSRKRFRALSRDRKQAEASLREIERNLDLKGVGLGQVVSLQQLTKDYLRLLEANNCTKTYLERVRIVLGHLERLFPGLRVPAVTAQLVDEYKLRRLRDGIGATTINREIGVIRAAIKKGRRWQYQVQDLSDVTPVRAAAKIRPAFTDDEVRTLLARAKADPRMRVLIMLGVYAGLRRMEMVNLLWGNIDFEQHKLVLGDGWKTKSGRARAIPLHPDLEAALAFWREISRGAASGPGIAQERVLPWSGTLHTLSGRFAYYARRQCGLGHGTLHSLRHTFLTALKRLDVDTGKIKNLAGHTNERTTQGYIHLEVGDLADAIGRLGWGKK
jgi:integrase